MLYIEDIRYIKDILKIYIWIRISKIFIYKRDKSLGFFVSRFLLFKWNEIFTFIEEWKNSNQEQTYIRTTGKNDIM